MHGPYEISDYFKTVPIDEVTCCPVRTELPDRIDRVQHALPRTCRDYSKSKLFSFFAFFRAAFSPCKACGQSRHHNERYYFSHMSDLRCLFMHELWSINR